MKLIDLHKEWCESGWINDSGLCYSVPKRYKNKLDLFTPTIEQRYSEVDFHYWGHGDKDARWAHLYFDYTPLRQTIVLLICAMNNEL